VNKKRIILIVILVLIVGFFLNKRKALKEDSNINPEESVICDFENKKVWGISPERGFSLRLSKKHVTEGKHSLLVVYPKWGLPSINTKKLKQDWGDYDSFAMDIYNPQKEEIDFAIRFDDVNNKRISIPYKLRSGLNKLNIDRKKIRSKINASKIRFLVLFINEPEKKYKLYFDNMRLERSGLLDGIEKESNPFDENAQKVSRKNRKKEKGLPFRKAVPLPKKSVITKGKIKVAIAKLKKTEDQDVFVSSGVPFAPGQLKSMKDFTLINPEGKEIPIAVKVLARWPQNQSIRSVLVQFVYPVEHVFEYVLMLWGTKRTARDLKIVEPNWKFNKEIYCPLLKVIFAFAPRRLSVSLSYI